MGSSENSRQSGINRWTLDHPARAGCLQSGDHAVPSAENYKIWSLYYKVHKNRASLLVFVCVCMNFGAF